MTCPKCHVGGMSRTHEGMLKGVQVATHFAIRGVEHVAKTNPVAGLLGYVALVPVAFVLDHVSPPVLKCHKCSYTTLF